MTCASKGNGCRESANATTDNGNFELGEVRGRRGGRERRVHEKVRVVTEKGRKFWVLDNGAVIRGCKSLNLKRHLDQWVDRRVDHPYLIS